MAELVPVRAIAVQKVSAPAYLHAVFSAWRARAVIVPTDDPAGLSLPNMPIAERLTIAPGGGWFDESLSLDDDPAPAQISFTSGTTGTPKPILLSRRALSDVTRRLNDAMRIDASIREYIGVPVTFSFGLGRARAVAAVGGKSYLPPNGFRPDEIAQMLGRGEINALAAVPTLLRILIQQAELFADVGGKLQWLEIGSQYMSAEEKAAIRGLFPNARIVQHYGLTEASRTTFLIVSEAEGEALESVGQAATRDALRIDADGRIAIRGPHVADGILTADGVQPLADADGWLTTNDLGAVDDAGFVYYKGRADHQLNVSGIKVPAELFEQRLAEAVGADGGKIAVAARQDPLRGEAVLVAYLPGVAVAPLQEQARAIAAGFGLSATDVSLVEVPEIPRTDTGKVRRGEITQLYGMPVAAAENDAPRGAVQDAFVRVFGDAARDEDMSFASLGGDSLNFVLVSMALGRVFSHAPDGWETMPIGTLAAMAAEQGDVTHRFPSIDANVLLRAVAILSVVINHANAAPIGGGANLLMLLVGYNLARFRGPAMLAGRIWGNVASYLRKIVIPYLILNIAYMAWRQEFHLSGVLGFTNLIGPDASPSLFPQWFVEALAQSIALIALLLSVPPLRRRIAAAPFVTMALLTAVAIVARFGIDLLWNADHLYNRVPWAFLPLLLLAWMISASRSTPEKLLCSIALLIEVVLEPRGFHSKIWLASGGLVLCWVPRVRVPGFVRDAAGVIASAVFYLYLLHEVWMTVARGVFHLRAPIVGALFGVLGPIAVWWVIEQSGLIGAIRGRIKALARR